MIVTYGLSTLDLNFRDLDDVVLVIYTNEITDELILSIDDLLLSNHIKFEPYVGDNFLFNVSLPVWQKFTENVNSLIFSGTLLENQFTYNHIVCMKHLENIYVEKMDKPFLNLDEIKNLLYLKRIIINANN